MRLVFISDTHGMHRRMLHPIPKGDVLVHCGDMTGHGSVREIEAVAAWLGAQPFRHIIAVAGNHDAAFEQPKGIVALAEDALYRRGVYYLRDSGLHLDGVMFWGAPWTPDFMDWHFMLPRHSPELKAKWDLIPDDTQVLITHGPPHKVRDHTCDDYQTAGAQDHAGCELLHARVLRLPELRVHAFGHIHEGYGAEGFDPLPTVIDANWGRPIFVNAATCNRNYEPANRPIVVDL